MNKADIIAEMADAAGISKAVAGKALDGMLGAIEGALKDGDKVTLVGFGTFSVAKRAARTGRNPQTKQDLQLKARRVVVFRTSGVLRKKINQKT